MDMKRSHFHIMVAKDIGVRNLPLSNGSRKLLPLAFKPPLAFVPVVASNHVAREDDEIGLLHV